MATDVPPVPRTAFTDPQTGKLTAAGQDFLERQLSRVGGAGNQAGWGGLVQTHRAGTNQTSIAASPTLIDYLGEDTDEEGYFSLALDRYIPKRRGRYAVFAMATFISPAADTLLRHLVYKNGSASGTPIGQGTGSASVVLINVACTAIVTHVDMNGDTDYLDHYALYAGGGGTLSGEQSETQFNAWRIA